VLRCDCHANLVVLKGFDPLISHLKSIAAIEDPAVIVSILTHLDLPAHAPPRSPARRVDPFQAA